jgi:hypothetical protein
MTDYLTRQPFLAIQELPDGPHRLIEKITRSVAVGWSPDSRRFFVNDYWASDASEVYIMDPVSLTRFRVSDAIRKRLPQMRKFFTYYDPNYLEAEDWVSDRIVRLRFWGWDGLPSPKTFDYTMLFDIGTGSVVVAH